MLRFARKWVLVVYAVLASLSAAAVAAVLGLPMQATPAHAIAAGLPSHFSFGLGAGNDNNGIFCAMPQTGVPWDYAMQYLDGGVKTNQGWVTWGANGTFPTNYSNGAAQHGYTTVFPFYELLQSSGTCGGCAENQTDITNLNNTGLMNKYY